jgi:glycosyltransferase involved in cell wall biosynthesis
MERLHIGLILDHSDPRRGGAESFAGAFAERLRARGHAVSVAARTGPHARPVPSRPAALRPLFFAKRFLPALRREGAERVVAFPPVPGCDFYQPRHGILAESVPPHWEPLPEPIRALRRWNPARVAHFAILRRLERAALKHPTRCIAIAPRVVADLARHHPAAAPPLLLRTGVDLERFRPAGREERASLRARLGLPAGALLLFVGHNHRLKGLATALRALDLLPGATLAVVGGGRRGVRGRVQWRGEDAALPEILRAADLLLHPTYYDTASRVVLEALASGVAPVTTARDGNADHAAEGGGAVLDGPGDPRALAGAVERLLAIPRDERASRARARAERFPFLPLLDAMVEAVTCAS